MARKAYNAVAWILLGLLAVTVPLVHGDYGSCPSNRPAKKSMCVECTKENTKYCETNHKVCDESKHKCVNCGDDKPVYYQGSCYECTEHEDHYCTRSGKKCDAHAKVCKVEKTCPDTCTHKSDCEKDCGDKKYCSMKKCKNQADKKKDEAEKKKEEAEKKKEEAEKKQAEKEKKKAEKEKAEKEKAEKEAEKEKEATTTTTTTNNIACNGNSVKVPAGTGFVCVQSADGVNTGNGNQGVAIGSKTTGGSATGGSNQINGRHLLTRGTETTKTKNVACNEGFVAVFFGGSGAICLQSANGINAGNGNQVLSGRSQTTGGSAKGGSNSING